MPHNGFYLGKVYLIVSPRARGSYTNDELLVRLTHKRPTELAADEYVMPLNLHVPVKCLSRSAGWSTVEAAAPGDVSVSTEAPQA